jgi:hypothetical protein
MKSIANAASFIVAVSMIGLVLFAQFAYQQSWSGSGIEPTVTADVSSSATPFSGGAESIVMK